MGLKSELLGKEQRGAETWFVIDLRTETGAPAAKVSLRGDGHTHTGVAGLVVLTDGSEQVRENGAFDCREWQWWEEHPYGNEKRPRDVPATCGSEINDGRLRVWSRYVCDGVDTQQEWFLADQKSADEVHYDCVQTISNVSGQNLPEYGQFFASYTTGNENKGIFFWEKEDRLVNFRTLGGKHLNVYMAAPDGLYSGRGNIPHMPRGDGRIGSHWKRPVLVGNPNANGFRHVILSEADYTIGLAMGMSGAAMDYIVYPGKLDLDKGEKFSVHIRHVFLKLPEGKEIAELERLWQDFEESHARMKAASGSPKKK